MRPSSASAGSIVDLRMLAAEKGYEIERSTIRDCWRLIGPSNTPAESPSGTKAFTVDEVRRFLLALPDHTSGWTKAAPQRGRKVSLKLVDISNVVEVDGLLDRLTAYSRAADGVAKRQDGAVHLLTGTPPGCDPSSKSTFVVMSGETAVGLVDVIAGYPRAGVAFIGLLAITEDSHRQGLGRSAFEAVESFAREKLRAHTLRLAVLDTNPVYGFWEKMGFRRTGEVRPFKGEAKSSLAALMEKALG